MRANDAAGKYRQKFTPVQGQGWTVAAAGQRRELEGGLDIVALDSVAIKLMLPEAGVPLVARLGVVI